MQVDEFDMLPKTICVDCWMTIEKFYEFYQNVIAAQKQFLLDGTIPIKIETPHEETFSTYVDDCMYI